MLGEEGGEERKGKQASLPGRIKSLRRKRLPEVDDGFATSLGVEGGVEQLRDTPARAPARREVASGDATRGATR